jgi:hypothetical protein
MRRRVLLGVLTIAYMALIVSQVPRPVPAPPVSAKVPVHQDIVPAGITVTESSSPAPPAIANLALPSLPAGAAPLIGDTTLANYGSAGSSPSQDMTLLARALTSFLTISKTASRRPLSANGEWSAALRGKRPGCEPWISPEHPIFDAQLRLTDRWHTPLHFHAQGANRWEIRSAGPDQKLWSGDDLLLPVSQ